MPLPFLPPGLGCLLLPRWVWKPSHSGGQGFLLTGQEGCPLLSYFTFREQSHQQQGSRGGPEATPGKPSFTPKLGRIVMSHPWCSVSFVLWEQPGRPQVSLFPSLGSILCRHRTITHHPRFRSCTRNHRVPCKCHHHSDGHTIRPQEEGANRLSGDGGGMGTSPRHKGAKTPNYPFLLNKQLFTTSARLSCRAFNDLVTGPVLAQLMADRGRTIRKTHDCGEDRRLSKWEPRCWERCLEPYDPASCLQPDF